MTNCTNCGHPFHEHQKATNACPVMRRNQNGPHRADWNAESSFQICLPIRPEWVEQIQYLADELEAIAADLDELHPHIAARCRALITGQEAGVQ